MPINPMINMQLPPAIDFQGPVEKAMSIADMMQQRQQRNQQQPLVMQGLQLQNQQAQQGLQQKATAEKHQELISQAFKNSTKDDGTLDFDKLSSTVGQIDPGYYNELVQARGLVDFHNATMQNQTAETQAKIQQMQESHDLALKGYETRLSEIENKNKEFSATYDLNKGKTQAEIDAERERLRIAREELKLKQVTAAKEGKIGEGLTKEQENDLQSTIKTYNPILAVRSPLGVAGKSINLLNQAEATFAKDRVTNDDAARGLRAINDAYASAGGAELDPTFYAKTRMFIEKLTAHPMNILSKSQKKEMLETIRTTREQNQRILDMNFKTGREALGSILDNPKAKERWENIEKLYQNPTATVDVSKMSGASSSGWNAAKEKRYQELLAKKNAGTIK
jgi:hypothetical protein